MTPAGDLDRVFRIEARDLLEDLASALLELEQHPGRTEAIDRCLRTAHTLKGAAQVAQRGGIAEIAHLLEEALAPYRGGAAAMDEDALGDLFALLSALQREVAALGQPEARGEGAPAAGAGEDRLETVRVEVTEVDAALEAAVEAGVQLGALRRGTDPIREAQRAAAALSRELRGGRAARALGPDGPGPRAEIAERVEAIKAAVTSAQAELSARIERVDRELAEVQRRLGALRLVPARAVFSVLELGARDAALALGKRVEVEVSGEDVRLEGHILAAARDALLQLIRNAVAHGIEPAEERARCGKPPEGRVRITVERRGGRAVFTCADDGRGMDVERLRAAAVRAGLLSTEAAAALGAEEAIRMALRPGLSTSEGVTGLSGRGVGLDVAAQTAARFGGELRIQSEPGLGTSVEIEVAPSLSSVPALMVIAEGTAALIPMDSVRSAIRIAAGEVHCDDAGESIFFAERAVPFAPLVRVLGAPAAAPRARWSVVIVRSEGDLVAVGVDRLLGSMEVIVKPLPHVVGERALVAGAALDAQGDPLLVLDPRALRREIAGMNPPAAAVRAPRRLPVLVIDDSLTTRTLERSILEAAGYEVDLAASAEEGLKKAKERPYGLFIVDIDMPGMSGLDFVHATRVDVALRDVPAIIVSAQASAADRRRGLEAGAAAYIVKSEFKQAGFLSTVSELLRSGERGEEAR